MKAQAWETVPIVIAAGLFDPVELNERNTVDVLDRMGECADLGNEQRECEQQARR